MTLSPREARELLERHGLSPRRAFGQNFVVDPNTVRRIARLANVGPGDRVVEIGPGLGSLTRALLETGASVTAVEIDHGLCDVLRIELADTTVTLVEGDALKLDWPHVLGGTGGWTMVANLPYNVATPLVCDLLDDVPLISRMLVMVQREVGDRMVAAAGTDPYGAVSVKIAYWGEARIAGYVPPTVFLPQPKVDSALVSITRWPTPAVPDIDRALLFSLVKAGFGQRRKMLRRALVAHVTPEAFEQAGIRPEARAEELDVQQWGALTRAVAALKA
jgi:16S rRNA (adenine1518-N6/adenine1519-N6)-dimethyltransferase